MNFVEIARLSLSPTAPRDGYILDFVCLRERLIVEVDGGQHNFDEHAVRDIARDVVFVRQGFKVLRFWSNEVDKNLTGVLQVIDDELMLVPPRSALPTTLPQLGEG